jgi:hypothetical protein
MTYEDMERLYNEDFKKYWYVRQSTINKFASQKECDKPTKRFYYKKSPYLKRIEKDIAECGYIRNDTINIIIWYIPPKPKKEKKNRKVLVKDRKTKNVKCRDSYIYHKIFDDYYWTINYCMICWSTKGLQIHHKDKNHKNNDISNLIKLCYRCHCMSHKWDKVYRLMIKKL